MLQLMIYAACIRQIQQIGLRGNFVIVDTSNFNILEKIIKGFITEYIQKQEIELFATQINLCLPIINRIYKKMLIGLKFPGIKIHGTLICDGHHRYVASILAGYELERIPGSISSVTAPVDRKSVSFLEEDWDTPAKIKMLNNQDAEYNNMTLGELVELLK